IGILAVSQFTLHGDLRKGRRPSYNRAAPPDEANRLYEKLVEQWRRDAILVETGVFGAHMDVTYTNEGPVTLLLDSRE
ncbi:MAG: D-aminoacyl-tRNA deacylase, partial [Spirochaetota bacterium]